MEVLIFSEVQIPRVCGALSFLRNLRAASFRADPAGARDIDNLIVGTKTLYLEVRSRPRRFGGSGLVRLVQGFASQLIDARDGCIHIFDLKTDVVDTQFHRLSVHTWAQIQNRDVQVTVSEIDTALTGAHFRQAERLLIKGGGLWDRSEEHTSELQ